MADGKKFTKAFFESALKVGMAKNFAFMRGARQHGKLHERSVAEILGRVPWHNQPQPPRTYTGAVHRLDNFDDKAICPHPSNIIIGSKIIQPFFISRRDGGEYEFVTHAEWERLKPLVPIYGERIGDQMRMYDRILAEGGYGDGYREKTITDQELINFGYRLEFRGGSFCESRSTNCPLAFDKAVAHGESWCIWRYEDGKIIVEEMGSSAPPEAPQPPKKPAKPVDFFPNKIDRIAKMPRYPGVWG